MKKITLNITDYKKTTVNRYNADLIKVIDKLVISTEKDQLKVLYQGQFVSLQTGDKLLLKNILFMAVNFIDEEKLASLFDNNLSIRPVLDDVDKLPMAHSLDLNLPCELDGLLLEKFSNNSLVFLFKPSVLINGKDDLLYDHHPINENTCQPLPLSKQHFQASAAVIVLEATDLNHGAYEFEP